MAKHRVPRPGNDYDLLDRQHRIAQRIAWPLITIGTGILVGILGGLGVAIWL